jgi:dTDP-4-dehydrorhamnose 3,5-epimerase-like enzyme
VFAPSEMLSPTLFRLDSYKDSKGKLNVLELPFEIKRIYTISHANQDTVRGMHGHKKLKQIFLAQSGSFSINLNNGINNNQFRLDNPETALFVPQGFWRELQDFSYDCICLVLASEHYDPTDYIYNFEDFHTWKKTQ